MHTYSLNCVIIAAHNQCEHGAYPRQSNKNGSEHQFNQEIDSINVIERSAGYGAGPSGLSKQALATERSLMESELLALAGYLVSGICVQAILQICISA